MGYTKEIHSVSEGTKALDLCRKMKENVLSFLPREFGSALIFEVPFGPIASSAFQLSSS